MTKLIALTLGAVIALPVGAIAQTQETAPAEPQTTTGTATPATDTATPTTDTTAAPAADTATADTQMDTATTEPAMAGDELEFVTNEPEGAIYANDFLGAAVYGTDGEKIGDINDVLVGRDGQVQSVIIGVGGFLGVGEKDVAVRLPSLDLDVVDGDNRISMDATEADLEAAPEFARADGTTSDRLGAFERNFTRTSEQATRALEEAGQRAGELAEEAETRASELIERSRRAISGDDDADTDSTTGDATTEGATTE